MRLRRKPYRQNLDSLLDTVVNVVGILIVLLAVMQITVSAAVRRVHTPGNQEEGQGTSTDSAASTAMLEKLAARARPHGALHGPLKVLRGRWAEVQADRLRAEVSLEPLGRAMAELEQEAAKQAADADRAEDLRSRATALDKSRKDLRAKLDKSTKELGNLEAALAGTPKRAWPKPKVVTLPDPRPAPENATPLRLICRYGRIIRYGERLEEKLENALRGIPPSAVDGKVSWQSIRNQFDRNIVGDVEFRWRIKVDDGTSGLSVRAVLEHRLRSTGGEGADDIRRPDSAFRTLLNSSDAAKSYVQFITWNDSFDIYMAARRIAQEAGFAAGWVVYSNDRDYQVILQGNDPASNVMPKID